MHLTIDFETRSACDIRKSGAWRYSEDATTEVMCLAIKVNDAPTSIWVNTSLTLPAAHDLPLVSMRFIAEAVLGATSIEAHNAEFERAIWSNCFTPKYGAPELPVEKLRCSAAKASSFALPRALGLACEAMGVPMQKDSEGYRLMLKMCKPRRPTKHDKSVWHEKPEDVLRLARYCIQDVEAEHSLSKSLRDLMPMEQTVYCYDQEINARGVQVDVEAARTVLAMIAEHESNLLAEVSRLTSGSVESVKQVSALMGHLSEIACEMDDIKRKTVEDALQREDLPPAARRLLEIRLSLSKASTAKYQAILAQVCEDGRIRGMFMYHGAGPGRWSGRGVQTQNLPRGTAMERSIALDVLKSGDLGMVRLLYGDPMDFFASNVRSMFMAKEGHELVCADFASIEARVLLWMAFDEDGLDLFRQGKDIYCDMASHIYGSQITKEDNKERQMGKQAILGLGFNMGVKKFMATCELQRIEIDEAMAERVIKSYREKYFRVVQFWRDAQAAAMEAVRQGSGRVPCGRVSYAMWGPFLHCQLPSGRLLSYCRPWIEEDEHGRETLRYMGVSSMSKRWEPQKTYGGKLVENIVQAVARDLMAAALVRVESAGYPVVLHAHDEIVSEVPSGSVRLAEYEGLMAETPEWASGLPVAAEGWIGERYRK